MTFIASMGLAMILAAIFTTVLELTYSGETYGWRYVLALLFCSFVGVLLLGSELGRPRNKVVKVCIFRSGSFLMDQTK
jgi:hypothetical protein